MEYIVKINDNDLVDSGGTKRIEEISELIRCKDCMYWSKDHDHQCMIKQGWFPVKPDWFCADGERR